MTHSMRGKGPLWIALALLLGTIPAAAQSRIAITPVTVVDVTDGSLAVDRAVLVEGGRIVAVEPAGSGAVPKGWTVVDGAGGYLIPGLWDMHTHRSWHFLELLIANGVTGVRDMGLSSLSLAEIEALRREILAAREVGPRLIAAGPTVHATGSADGALLSATTPERGRWLVDSLSAAGADFVKVYELPRDTYFAIAEQAVKRGIPIAGHLSDGVTLEEAAEAGQQSVEHYTRSHPLGLLPMCSSQPDRLSRALEEIGRLGVPPRDSVHLAHRREFMRLAVDTYDDERCRSTLHVLAGFETWHM